MRSLLRILPVFVLLNVLYGQSPNATVAGRVIDPSNAVIAAADVEVINLYTNIHYTGQTNREGSFVIPGLPPAPYRIEVKKSGFKTVIREDVVLRVQDVIALNFILPIGSVTESVTVEGGAPLVDTQDASVSTVVDRNFAENLPLNGRSFQSLVELTPGVVVVPSNPYDNGQFSVNGQRASSNYWMVDGVSANAGVSAAGGFQSGNGPAGATASFSTLGGTNGLVSVDAMQEFRIQTSTYAPEFGRTPGAQISIATRAGTNQFHGTVFDYFRNDALDASDWFNSSVTPTLPKAKERQNDFGGTLGGPIWKDKTFFFFSYEGLRLRLPTTKLTSVPDTSPADPFSRQFALPAVQPYLNAFPQPNGPEVLDARGNHQGVAQFNGSFSNPASLDAYSIRMDQKVGNNWTIFGHYNYSPSGLSVRGGLGAPLSIIEATSINSHSATLAATGFFLPGIANDFRFNYSRAESSSNFIQDSLGSSTPLNPLPIPSPFTAENGFFGLFIFSIPDALQIGQLGSIRQQQTNFVDGVSLKTGSHSLKFGVDFRRLTPNVAPKQYGLFAFFSNVPAIDKGKLLVGAAQNVLPATFLFRNLSAYGEDTWRMTPRLTMTYGLRWDIDFTPQTVSGPNYAAVTNFDLNDLSKLALAPAGTDPFRTAYGNVAPRIGGAYQLSQKTNWLTTLRGGFGVFYDLVTAEAGSINGSNYPFGSRTLVRGSFPFAPPAPAPITVASVANGQLFAFDPNLKAPYTLQWNVAVEQGIGNQQAVSLSYVGASGRRLLQSFDQNTAVNQNIGSLLAIANAGGSNYNALQIQFQRRMSRGVQALVGYTWAHSIDNASAGSLNNLSDFLIPGSTPNLNRGPSDFDIRHAFSAGITYDIPIQAKRRWLDAVVRGWSADNFVLARSAPPVDISDANFFGFANGTIADTRPDLVAGQPLYLYGKFPGGKAFNPAAFADPAVDPNTGNPLRQGTAPRNLLRGFGAVQWDFAVHREFPVYESWKLQFRAEMFNVLNHPNFGPPNSGFGSTGFGISNQMLGQALNGGNLGGGALSPLYQIGGPRSIQLALKLRF